MVWLIFFLTFFFNFRVFWIYATATEPEFCQEKFVIGSLSGLRCVARPLLGSR